MPTGEMGGREDRQGAQKAPSPPRPALQQRAKEEFWRSRQKEIEAMVDYKEHVLPMFRLKEVILAGEGGMMVSADTSPFVTKLCELFIQELAVRAWACAESHHRHTILDSDIAEAIARAESYHFLVGVLRRHGVQAAQININERSVGHDDGGGTLRGSNVVQQLQTSEQNGTASDSYQGVVLQQSADVQDASGGEGRELASEPLLSNGLGEVLKDDEPLVSDADLVPHISSATDMDEPVKDPNFLDDVVSSPRSSTSND